MRRRYIIILVALLLLALAAWFVIIRQSNPHSLSGLLARLDDGKGEIGITWELSPPPAPTKRQLEAAEAIHQMGTNAVPELLTMLQTRERLPSSSRRFIQEWLNRFNIRIPQLDGSQTPATRARHRAALGFIALGPNVRPPISQLIPLFKTTDFSKETALVLADSGPEGLVPLREAITNSRPGSWQILTAMWAMSHFPTNAHVVVPAAISGATNSDLGVRLCSIFVLDHIQTEPQMELEALTNCISDQTIAFSALQAIGNYGTRATSAVPILVDLLKSPTRGNQAAEILKIVDPQAAANAGVK